MVSNTVFRHLSRKQENELQSTLSIRANFYRHKPYLVLPKLNYNILEQLDLERCDMEDAKRVISAAPLPNLKILTVSTATTDLFYGHQNDDSSKVLRLQLLEAIAKNTGALTHFYFFFYVQHAQAKISRSILKSLRLITAADPNLRLLDFGHNLSHMGSIETSKTVHFLSKFQNESSSKEPVYECELWSSLPELVQSVLGIPISQLRFNGLTMWQYYCDYLIAPAFSRPRRLFCSTKEGELSALATLESLWSAVYPAVDLCGGSTSIAPNALSAFSVFFKNIEPLVSYPDSRTMEPMTLCKPVVKWIISKAKEVFKSIDLQVTHTCLLHLDSSTWDLLFSMRQSESNFSACSPS
jgi:hypothetical protein